MGQVGSLGQEGQLVPGGQLGPGGCSRPYVKADGGCQERAAVGATEGAAEGTEDEAGRRGRKRWNRTKQAIRKGG